MIKRSNTLLYNRFFINDETFKNATNITLKTQQLIINCDWREPSFFWFCLCYGWMSTLKSSWFQIVINAGVEIGCRSYTPRLLSAFQNTAFLRSQYRSWLKESEGRNIDNFILLFLLSFLFPFYVLVEGSAVTNDIEKKVFQIVMVCCCVSILWQVFDSAEDLRPKVETLAKLIKECQYLVVHSGAGISTSTGIPDFR